MKANELMIGDWVYIKNIAKPMQVYPKMLFQMLRSNPNATTEDYNIFPVPLTPEILEKNGFKMVLDIDKLPTYRIKWTRNPNLYFTVFTGVDGYWNPVGYGVTIAGVNGVIDYVHQLQHAMRLCGINKEIVL